MTLKDDIRRNFSSALCCYNEESHPQRMAADKLLSLLQSKVGMRFDNILELGCGTGHFTKPASEQLQWKSYTANDLCPAVAAVVGAMDKNIRFIEADAEKLPFEGKFELICASSVIQWFCNLESFFQRCAEKLSPQGVIAFTSFGQFNMKEIRELTGVGLNYMPISWYDSVLSQNFDVLHLSQETVQLEFDSPGAVLKHIRNTGAVIPGGFRFTPRTYAKFFNDYAALFCTNGKYTLTYNPIYILAKLK